jgi:hypothetical protein
MFWKFFCCLSFLFISFPVYSQDASFFVEGAVIQVNHVEGNPDEILNHNRPQNLPIIFKDGEAYIAIDYFQPVVIKAITLKADGNNVYETQYSLDGQHWNTLTFIPQMHGTIGLQTRNIVLYQPTKVRYVALRPAGGGDGSYAISRFLTYSEVPASWSWNMFKVITQISSWGIKNILMVGGLFIFPLLVLYLTKKIHFHIEPTTTNILLLTGLLISLGVLGYFMQTQLIYYRVLRYVIKALLLLLAVFIVPWVQQWKRAQLGKGKAILISVLFLVSFSAYFNFGSLFGDKKGFIHYYDCSAYFLGSKYFSELGQHDLFVAFLAATREGPNPPTIKVIRDLRTREPIAVDQVQEEVKNIHQKFTPERWEEFKRDSIFFQNHFGSNLEDFLQDHGYNPSPVWTLVGKTLTNALSKAGLDTERALNILTKIDLILLSGIFILIYYAFGLPALIYSFVFWCANPLDIFNYLSGAFFRESWLFGMVACVCFYKMQRYVLSGVCIAYAMLERLFPGALIVFPALHFFYLLFRRKAIPSALIKFGSSICITSIILLILSSYVAGGTDKWNVFYQSIKKHNTGIYTNHISLRNLYVIEPGKTFNDFNKVDSIWRLEKEKRTQYYLPAFRFMGLFLFGLFLFAFWKESDLKGMQMSCILPFLFFYPANYYFSFLILLILYFLDEPHYFQQGFFALLAIGSLTRVFLKADDLFYPYLSFLLLVTFFWILANKITQLTTTTENESKLGFNVK